jgi:hypothetical protein
MKKKPGPEDPLESIRVRAVIEEAHANIFVENFLYDSVDNMRIVWIRFFAKDATVDGVLNQIRSICTDFNIQLVIFAVGRSYYLSFSNILGSFFKVRRWKSGKISTEEMERMQILPSHVKSRVKNLFLEDRWRQIIYEKTTAAQQKS